MVLNEASTLLPGAQQVTCPISFLVLWDSGHADKAGSEYSPQRVPRALESVQNVLWEPMEGQKCS